MREVMLLTTVDGLGYREVAAILDPLGNAVHTALKVPVKDRTVAIVGFGPIGAMCGEVTAFVGARAVFVIDVADHALDLGLIESPSHVPGVITEVCCEDELVVICAPAHRFAQTASVKPGELAGEPFVSRELGSGTREFTDQYLRRCQVAPEDLNIVMELGSPEAIKGVVETGLGVSIMSRARVVKERKLATLAAVPLEPVMATVRTSP